MANFLIVEAQKQICGGFILSRLPLTDDPVYGLEFQDFETREEAEESIDCYAAEAFIVLASLYYSSLGTEDFFSSEQIEGLKGITWNSVLHRPVMGALT